MLTNENLNTSGSSSNSGHSNISSPKMTTTTTTTSSKKEQQKTFQLADDERLNYKVHQYSSFSTNYFPENILVDCPSDQTSRWSAHTNSPPQYLILKLQRPAIVKRIKFGKFEKSHVCNIKKFRIFGGLDEQRLVLLLEAGLKNDNVPEVFNLRHRTEDGSGHLPILYIKIVPLLSWGPTFNFSIWYIELHGQDDPMFTSNSMRNYNMLREIEIVKMCLKHFRQQGYDAAFKALQQQTQVCLESPLITELHKHLVCDGDFAETENFIEVCIQDGLMDDYLSRQDYKHNWRMQNTISTEKPGYRGGHQLVFDTQKRLIYLYGGWDGYQDMSDLWVYDITQNSWTRLFLNSEQFNGPTPRSCHKMVFDPISENIFMLGRYLDNSIRTTEYIKSDFFLYDTRSRSWLQICDDTSQVGGPQLVYDHQMCIDAQKRTIYVFGGKILTPRSVNTAVASSEPEYSGLFSYHIDTNTWTQILVDCHHPSAAQADVLSIKSRITHCMVFHSKQRKLYIYGGQRGKEDIDEFITYDVDSEAIAVLNKSKQTANAAPGSSTDATAKEEPSPGYTLRATIDCERDEIYVFSSLSKLKDRRDLQHIDASNSFWVYSLKTRCWSKIYTCRHSADVAAAAQTTDSAAFEPCPRYAHQLVYDDVAKLHYLFGGNPGRATHPQLRLDDFWLLELQKPTRLEILRHCRYLVRKLNYEEMARSEPRKAISYLQQHIAEVIDRNNSEQVHNFHKLAGLLFNPDNCAGVDERSVLMTPPLGAVNDADYDLSQRTDMDVTTQAADDLSMESLDSNDTANSISSSGISDLASYNKYRQSGGKRARHDFVYELRNRRAFLFNKLVCLMPAHMVQPERNLSDFVVM